MLSATARICRTRTVLTCWSATMAIRACPSLRARTIDSVRAALAATFACAASVLAATRTGDGGSGCCGRGAISFAVMYGGSLTVGSDGLPIAVTLQHQA